jgi:hypothetical protein
VPTSTPRRTNFLGNFLSPSLGLENTIACCFFVVSVAFFLTRRHFPHRTAARDQETASPPLPHPTGTLVGRRHTRRTPAGQLAGLWAPRLPSPAVSFVDARKLFDSLPGYEMDSADEFFFQNFLCDSDDSSPDDDEEILAVVLVHHHLNSQRPLFCGSIPDHLPALNRNRESGHFLLWKDYFDTTNPLFKH